MIASALVLMALVLIPAACGGVGASPDASQVQITPTATPAESPTPTGAPGPPLPSPSPTSTPLPFLISRSDLVGEVQADAVFHTALMSRVESPDQVRPAGVVTVRIPHPEDRRRLATVLVVHRATDEVCAEREVVLEPRGEAEVRIEFQPPNPCAQSLSDRAALVSDAAGEARDRAESRRKQGFAVTPEQASIRAAERGASQAFRDAVRVVVLVSDG